MGQSFSELLRKRQREGKLQGRPLSQEETTAAYEGASREATNRLVAQKQLAQRDTEIADAAQRHKDEMERDRDDRKAARKSTQASSAVSGAVAGMTLGAAKGSIGGPAGAVIGGAVGLLAGSCIIISACTSRDSYDVKIAREFRDNYMSLSQLGGYYALAYRISPLIDKSHFLKLFFKKFLVDRLVDYGEWILGYKPKRTLRTSYIVTNSFLSLCATIGMQIDIRPHIEAHRS